MSLKQAVVADDFPERLKVVLRSLGLSRAELGTLIGVTPKAINNWISGANKPSTIVFDVMSGKIGAPATRYLSGQSDKPPALVVKS